MAPPSRGSKMQTLLNYRLKITMTDSRTLIGQLLAFDKHLNLVLADCEEFRKIKVKKQTPVKEETDTTKTTTTSNDTAADSKIPKEKEEKRTLGLTILRGENIVSISIEGKPSQGDAKMRTNAIFNMGLGRGIPGARGIIPPNVPPMGGLPGMGMGMGMGMPPPSTLSASATAPPPGLGAPGRGQGPPPSMMMPPQGMPGMPPPGYPPHGLPGMPPPGWRPPMGAPGGPPPPGFPGRG